METLALKRENLKLFLEACEQTRRVQIPVAAGSGQYRLAPMVEVGAGALALECLRTMLPPKKYFFPPEEPLYHFDGTHYMPVEPTVEPSLIFGLHPCDLAGVMVTDRFFSRKHPDRSYWARRNQTAFVGLGCMPDSKCFCTSTHNQYVDSLYDLFMWDLGDRFLTYIRTETGQALVHAAEDLFTKTTEQDGRDYLAMLDRRNQAFTLKANLDDLPQILEVSDDNETWQHIASACFTCGKCAMVCPTCTCYDLYDKTSLNGEGERVRRWTSCFFRDFTRVAGEHIFRNVRVERIKNRFMHKEHGYVNAFGAPACVGCGRCITVCPAGINVVSLYRRLRNAAAGAECSSGAGGCAKTATTSPA